MTARPKRARDRGRDRALRVGVAAVIALAIGTATLAPPAGPAPVSAAVAGLSLVTASSYSVLPDEGRVAVTVRITATNALRDTVTKQFYFTEGYLSVLPGTSNFAITAATGSPTVAVSSHSATGTVLRIRFGSRLVAGESRALTLTFDIVDPGGAPDRPLRLSPSLVSFEAWAFGTVSTPGSSVDVFVPAGYDVTLGRGPLLGPTTDAVGVQAFASGPLDTPLDFAVDVRAVRPGGFVMVGRSVDVAGATVDLRIRSWPDDPSWRVIVVGLLRAGLPALAEAIGSPWPIDGPLTVQESFVRDADGVAGAFDPDTALLEVSYLASPTVVIHAAAHGWFNGRLVADRWIAEGFAWYYGAAAADAIGIPVLTPDLAAVAPDAALSLNAWGAAGSTADQDAYGQAASIQLAHAIAAIVGDARLQAVWRSAAAGIPAYSPPAGTDDAEAGAPAPDWRSLLDLLQEGATPAQAAALEGLWRGWVVRAGDAGLLDQRLAARARYQALVAKAAPWVLPASIRDALRAWQFETGSRLMAQASSVLSQRASIEDAAAAAGLVPPDAVRAAFEGGAALALAGAEAAIQLEALERINAAAAARIGDVGPVERLGLLGSEPDAAMAAAGVAFEAGDMDAAIRAAADAETAWQAIPDVARGRMISGALLGAAGALAILLLVQWRRRRPAGWSSGGGSARDTEDAHGS